MSQIFQVSVVNNHQCRSSEVNVTVGPKGDKLSHMNWQSCKAALSIEHEEEVSLREWTLLSNKV